MRIALAQINYHIGNIDYNLSRMQAALIEARQQRANLVVFSELSICGYPPGDLLNQEGFIGLCMKGIEQLAASCQGIAAIAGGPLVNDSGIGKRLYNAAFLLENGQIRAVRRKALLPTYDVFDEYRYFEPCHDNKVVEFQGKRIALTICEDIWDTGDQRLYRFSPMQQLSMQSPDLMINLSASPFAWNRIGERIQTISRNCTLYKLPLFYVNQVGANTELIFDGGSAVFSPSAELMDVFEPFRESIRVYELNESNEISVPAPLKSKPFIREPSEQDKNALLLEALEMGVRDYFFKSGFSRAILGLSGGLDSALCLVLAARALGADNCRALLLPGPFSSSHSISDAVSLAEKLEVAYDIISIEGVNTALQASLSPWFEGLPADVTEENLQARSRAILLMAMANKFGYMLLNTSNKSEAAVGYGTLYGDMCGGLSVIGDLYKTEVFSLSRYINRHEEIIPWHSLEKPPSAELRPDQKDTDSLPPYEQLDSVLFDLIEREMSPEQLRNAGHDPALVSRVSRLLAQSEHKRKQSPPVLRVSRKAFGMGRKMPIVARYPE